MCDSGCCCCQCVSQGEMGIREKLGQFSGFARPGCTCLLYPCENIVGKLSTRVQQLSVNTQTKTKDNVTLTVAVAVQFRVIDRELEAGSPTDGLCKFLKRAASEVHCMSIVWNHQSNTFLPF